MKPFIHFLFLVGSIIISHLINNYIIDELLEVFKIMSYFALIANRVALTLFIYYVVDMFFLTKNYHFREIVNKLFFIYLIWLSGMLYGRFTKIEDYDLAKHFNFISFIPNWINHLGNRLVFYYIIGNIVIYIPFGMFIRYHKKLIYSILLFIILIFVFETLQGITNLGYFDIDDILLNGIGGIFGIFIMHIYKIFKKTNSEKQH
ncbi:MAG: VanZ family protein [Haloplasmataceae bacterium]|jgi:glycopeptide antibiotics resistance protein|nr:VanZ family protein [Haloplasmataceae bacterium]